MHTNDVSCLGSSTDVHGMLRQGGSTPRHAPRPWNEAKSLSFAACLKLEQSTLPPELAPHLECLRRSCISEDGREAVYLTTGPGTA